LADECVAWKHLNTDITICSGIAQATNVFVCLNFPLLSLPVFFVPPQASFDAFCMSLSVDILCHQMWWQISPLPSTGSMNMFQFHASAIKEWYVVILDWDLPFVSGLEIC